MCRKDVLIGTTRHSLLHEINELSHLVLHEINESSMVDQIYTSMICKSAQRKVTTDLVRHNAKFHDGEPKGDDTSKEAHIIIANHYTTTKFLYVYFTISHLVLLNSLYIS